MTSKTTAKKKVKKTKTLEAVSIKGASDILPKDAELWRTVTDIGRHLSELYDFHLIETPLLEHRELFVPSVGEVASRKLCSFATEEGEEATLRADFSAPILRSYIEHHLGYFASPLKVYHCGSVVSREKTDIKKNCESRQWGFDIVGDNDAVYDMQVILAALEFLKLLKFQNLRLKMNTMGCKVCRPNYREKLKAYYRKLNLCADCKKDLEEYPLHIFNCKREECVSFRKDAPIVLDYLCQACNNHFKSVLELVEDNGVLYEPNPYFVGEKEHYNRSIFEIYSGEHEEALASGGRYDYLSEALFGRLIPGVGVALNLDHIVAQLKLNGTAFPRREKSRVFFVAVGDRAKKLSVRLMNMLRMSNVAVVEALGKKTLSAQIKFGEKLNVPVAFIFGQKEVFENSIIMRDMKSGAQETIALDKLVEEAKKRLK